MSNNDASMASLVEDWIVDQIATLTPFSDDNVLVYPGTRAKTGSQLIDEFTRLRSPFALVTFVEDVPVRRLTEGEQAYDPTYAIYIIVRSEREGKGRTGEDRGGGNVIIGTNGIRDLLRTALHDKIPGITAGGFYAQQSRFNGVRLLFERNDAFVMLAEVVITEETAG